MHFLPHFKPNDWILYFPQFHFAIGIVALVNLTMTIAIFVVAVLILIKVRANHHLLAGTCPCCRKNTLSTVQHCGACAFTRVLTAPSAGGEEAISKKFPPGLTPQPTHGD
jgi:hypothetical protein